MRAAIRNLRSERQQGQVLALVNSLDKNADKSNGGKAGKTMSEVYQYYSGLAPYSGNSKVKTDYTSTRVGHRGVERDLRTAAQRARFVHRHAVHRARS